MKSSISGFARYAWGLLVYNIFVVLFGAFVRATGSGAGCGAHWPLCNGVIIPRPERIETMIEFTHRLMSGATLILVAVLIYRAWKTFPPGSRVRFASGLVVLFTLTEALVGAGLVLFKLVENNDSIARAISMPVHLVNTFLLLGSITLTAWMASGEPVKQLHFHGFMGALLTAGSLALLLLGASGAVTALGDTLFPSTSLAEGIRQDFSPTAHYLIRLRVYHPGIAVGVGIIVFLITVFARGKSPDRNLALITNSLFTLYGLQILLGVVNVALLAPIWMQIVHLLVSNLIWIVYVLMTLTVLGTPQLSPSIRHEEIHHGVRQTTE